MPKSGRPRALDEAKQAEICALISQGCGMETAARYVACAASTIRREARRNRKFNAGLRRAYLNAELMPLNAVRRAAEKNWRAGAWLLERMNVQRFARQDPRYVTPEQVRDFVDVFTNAVLSSTQDDEVRRRLFQNAKKYFADIDREIRLEEAETVPRSRRRRKPASRPRAQKWVSDSPDSPSNSTSSANSTSPNDASNV